MNINIQFRLEHVQILKVPLNSFNILTDCKDMIEKDTPYQQAPSLFKLKVSKAS